MMRTFQFRLLPNMAQRVAMDAILADNCETYNAALQERRDAWKLERKSITRYMQQAELTELRRDARYAVTACQIQRDALRRVELAFAAFFRRVKAGQAPGFPRFRSVQRYDSFSFGLRRTPGTRIRIPNVGVIRLRGGRAAVGIAKRCTIKRDGRRWWASLVCDIGPAPAKVTVDSMIGIDVGLTALATLSDGTTIENPRWTRVHEDRIAQASHTLSRKERRSNNRVMARQRLRRAHQSAANARTNYLHHISKWLISQYNLIAYEDLKIRNMVRSNLAKGILDAAWGQLVAQLKYKAESAGTWVIPVRPHGTTIRCSECGKDVPKTLAERQHDCPHCGLSLSRDHNAARNILALGISAAGVSLQNPQLNSGSSIRR